MPDCLSRLRNLLLVRGDGSSRLRGRRRVRALRRVDRTVSILNCSSFYRPPRCFTHCGFPILSGAGMPIIIVPGARISLAGYHQGQHLAFLGHLSHEHFGVDSALIRVPVIWVIKELANSVAGMERPVLSAPL